MASISRDKNGNIVIRVYAGVNPVTKKPRTISKTLPSGTSDEVVEQASHELEQRANILKGVTCLTIGAAIDYYLEGCELTDMSPSTIAAYRSYANAHIKQLIGDVLIDKAYPAIFSQLYRTLLLPVDKEGRGLSATTVEKIHAFLSGCFSTLESDGAIERNPMQGVKVSHAKSKEVQPLSKADFGKLMKYLEETVNAPVYNDSDFEKFMFAVMVYVDVHTGCRRGELSGFRRKHHLKHHGSKGLRVVEVIIQIRHGQELIRKPPKSSTSKRFLSLDAKTDSYLNLYKAVQKRVLREHGVKVTSETPLFTHADGTLVTPNQITQMFKELVKDLGLDPKAHLHTLRHTHATLLILDGADILSIQNRYGHASSKTTVDLYGHLLPGRDQEIADSFAGIAEAYSQVDDEDDDYIRMCPVLHKPCARFYSEKP